MDLSIHPAAWEWRLLIWNLWCWNINLSYMDNHLQPLGNGGCCRGLWWFCRHSWGYDQRQVRITWKLNVSTFPHIQDALHVWKFQDYAWQSWSAIFPEVHPPLVSKVLFSECRTTWSSLPNKEESTFCLFHWNSSTIPFLKLSSVQLLRNVTLWRFIPQQKRLPPNWQSTSSCPHTYPCYCWRSIPALCCCMMGYLNSKVILLSTWSTCDPHDCRFPGLQWFIVCIVFKGWWSPATRHFWVYGFWLAPHPEQR